jgi:hypothetical protein
MTERAEKTIPETKIDWTCDHWLSLGDIHDPAQAAYIQRKFPDADAAHIVALQRLLKTAREFAAATRRNLHIFGDVGELYGAVVHGIELNRRNAVGSDGRLGDDFVEIKTITPFKNKQAVHVRMDRNFNKLLVVRVLHDFSVQGVLVSRSDLPKSYSTEIMLEWEFLERLAGTREA